MALRTREAGRTHDLNEFGPTWIIEFLSGVPICGEGRENLKTLLFPSGRRLLAVVLVLDFDVEMDTATGFTGKLRSPANLLGKAHFVLHTDFGRPPKTVSGVELFVCIAEYIAVTLDHDVFNYVLFND